MPSQIQLEYRALFNTAQLEQDPEEQTRLFQYFINTIQPSIKHKLKVYLTSKILKQVLSDELYTSDELNLIRRQYLQHALRVNIRAAGSTMKEVAAVSEPTLHALSSAHSVPPPPAPHDIAHMADFLPPIPLQFQDDVLFDPESIFPGTAAYATPITTRFDADDLLLCAFDGLTDHHRSLDEDSVFDLTDTYAELTRSHLS